MNDFIIEISLPGINDIITDESKNEFNMLRSELSLIESGIVLLIVLTACSFQTIQIIGKSEFSSLPVSLYQGISPFENGELNYSAGDKFNVKDGSILGEQLLNIELETVIIDEEKAQIQIKGKVSDSQTGVTCEGVSIFTASPLYSEENFSKMDFKIQAVTKTEKDGSFYLKSIISEKMSLFSALFGYRTIRLHFDKLFRKNSNKW